MSVAGNLDHPGCPDQSASCSGAGAVRAAKKKKKKANQKTPPPQSHTLLINLKSNKINTKNCFYKVILLIVKLVKRNFSTCI